MRPHIALPDFFLVLLLVILSTPGRLLAAPEDTVQAYVNASITNDDNLLRLSESVDPLTVTGQPTAADTIRQGTLGVIVDWKQSRQELMLDVSVNKVQFARFTSLDYQATNIRSRWNWQLGNRLNGEIGYNRNTTLGSFAEQQNLTNNLNTQQNKFINFAWQATPDWRLNSSISSATYSVAGNSIYGNESMNYASGIYFTPRSGNEIGIKGSHQIQKYPVLQPIGAALVDNGFTQDQLLATIDWHSTGNLRFHGQAGVVNRNQKQLSERNFRGNTMRGTLTWLASGKSQVNLSAWDEIDPYDDLTTSYTQSKGISLGPTWNPTAKLLVSARLQHLNRYYLGDPLLKLYPWLLIPVRHDTINTVSLTLDYQPVRDINISTSIQTEHRSSSQLFADYADKTINLTVSFKF